MILYTTTHNVLIQLDQITLTCFVGNGEVSLMVCLFGFNPTSKSVNNF